MFDKLNDKLMNWVGFELFYGITMKSTYVLLGSVFLYFTYHFWFAVLTELGTDAGVLIFSFILYVAIMMFIAPMLIGVCGTIGMWIAIVFRVIKGLYLKICP